MKFSSLTIIALLCFVFSLQSCNFFSNGTKSNNKASNFPNTDYERVVAYDYEDIGGGYIINKGVLNATVKKEAELNAEQVKNLLEVLNEKETYGGDQTRCFYPRLGVVFYDKENKATAHLSICFECNHQYAYPAIKANTQAPLHGYSSAGRAKLIEFCKSLGFSNCGKKDSDTPTQ